MKARPDRAAPPLAADGWIADATAMPPASPALAPWRARRADRVAGLPRSPRTALVCRLWRRLFPSTASAAVLAEILANIAPYVLRRGGRGARPGRTLPPPPSRLESGVSFGAPCGRVPVAARAGSGR